MFRQIGPTGLALLVALGIAAAGTGENDYALLIGDDPLTCAKSAGDCRAAIDALLAGRWIPLPRSVPPGQRLPEMSIFCVPHPGCFSERSNCIAGYNCQ